MNSAIVGCKGAAHAQIAPRTDYIRDPVRDRRADRRSVCRAAGKAPAPDWDVIDGALRQLAIAIGGSASVAVMIAVALVILLAALAPIIFAARSGDLVTVLISIVLVASTWLLVFQSRTIIDMTMAAVIYLASMTLSAIVYLDADR